MPNKLWLEMERPRILKKCDVHKSSSSAMSLVLQFFAAWFALLL